MKEYQQIFNALPSPCLLLKPMCGQFYIMDVNKEYINATAKKKEELREMIIPDVFPENPELHGTNWAELYDSLNKALITGKPDGIETLRYDIFNCETDDFDENYWQVENIPIKDEK